MPKLTHVRIQNYRSCRDTELPLSDFTPLVGCNNGGKSNIMGAIRWLLRPSKLGPHDFQDESQPVIVTGTIAGVSSEALERLDAKHRKSIEPYCHDGTLRIRQRQDGPTQKPSELQVPKPEGTGDEWKANPTGIRQAIQALFPEPVEIGAMENVPEDVAKSKSGTTIQQLISEVMKPLMAANGEALEAALRDIQKKLTADGHERAQELDTFDAAANRNLAALFPGVTLKIDVPPPEVEDLFKSGTIKVYEDGHGVPRSVEAMGHGAQRSIQMALIRQLAELKGISPDGSSKTLLLVDEPELYLHPQGVELVRLALKTLSNGGYQLVFSTHSPHMIRDDEDIKRTVIVRRDLKRGTFTLPPMEAAISTAVEDGPAQRKALLELGNASKVLFSDRVLLVEGETENFLLPHVFPLVQGKTLEAVRVGLVRVCGSGNLIKAKKILDAMQVPAKVIADLDFAFRHACPSGLICGETLAAAPGIFRRLAKSHADMNLCSSGLPEGARGKMKVAEAFAIFAADPEGQEVVGRVHDELLGREIWVWQRGDIERHLGISDKGEKHWLDYLGKLEEAREQAILDIGTIRELVGWVVAQESSSAGCVTAQVKSAAVL